MPVTTPPTFKPPFFEIELGAEGTVLTSNGEDAAPTFQAGGGGGGGTLGTYVAVVLDAGANNNVNPAAGWPNGYGRVDFDTSAGVANVTGLLAGSDGQMILARNIGVNNLTLNNQNAGSLAANQFIYVNDLVLPQYASALLVYYGGSINAWVI